jgi:hypothetical protein
MTQDFKATFIRKLSQKKWNEFEKTVRSLMKDSVEDWKTNRNVIELNDCEYNTIRPSINDSDYCHAFGIVQGICYYCLGYTWLGADNEEGSPKKWIRDMETEFGKLAYQRYLASKSKTA